MSLSGHLGEVAALFTAVCWAVTSTAFEHSGKKIGSMNLNLIRLVIGLSFLSLYRLITKGEAIPLNMASNTWFWLSLSGVVGIVLGDLLLFEAFVVIGARISMLIYASVPPLSGFLAFVFLGESMNLFQIIGMTITIVGISIVILVKNTTSEKLTFAHPIKGIVLAFGGAIGQSAGYILGKFGMAASDPFEATQIRLIAGLVGFIIIFTLRNYWKTLIPAFKQGKAMISVTIGSFFGPFVGISLSLYAVQRINPGVASTLMSITPILLIPVAVFIKREKVSLREVLGSLLAMCGIAIMFV